MNKKGAIFVNAFQKILSWSIKFYILNILSLKLWKNETGRTSKIIKKIIKFSIAHLPKLKWKLYLICLLSETTRVADIFFFHFLFIFMLDLEN